MDLLKTCICELVHHDRTIKIISATVSKQTNTPIMLVIPWGNEGRKEMLSVVDIIVPGC